MTRRNDTGLRHHGGFDPELRLLTRAPLTDIQNRQRSKTHLLASLFKARSRVEC
jgi:hypothetical protein